MRWAKMPEKIGSDVIADSPKKAKNYEGLKRYWAKIKEEIREKIIEALRNTDKPFLNLQELSDQVEHSTYLVKDVAEELEKEGKIVHKELKIPFRSHLFYLSDDYIKGIEVEKILNYNRQTFGGD
jgi:predicted nucleotide-binding protein (sugar kinase/HSP70/actin superfamily)